MPSYPAKRCHRAPVRGRSPGSRIVAYLPAPSRFLKNGGGVGGSPVTVARPRRFFTGFPGASDSEFTPLLWNRRERFLCLVRGLR